MPINYGPAKTAGYAPAKTEQIEQISFRNNLNFKPDNQALPVPKSPALAPTGYRVEESARQVLEDEEESLKKSHAEAELAMTVASSPAQQEWSQSRETTAVSQEILEFESLQTLNVETLPQLPEAGTRIFHQGESEYELPAGWRLMGYLHNTYIFFETPEGMEIVEQHIAHERTLYERLLAAQKTPGRISEHTQTLLS